MAKKKLTALELIQHVSGNTKSELYVVGENKKMFTPDYYISTGITLVNCLLSGDPYKGMPGNLSVQFTGKASSGKSLLLKMMARNFQMSLDNAVIDAYETEGAIDEKDWSKFINTKTLIHNPVKHVIDLKNSIKEKLKIVEREQNWLIVVDSIGNLPDSEQYEKNQKLDSTPTMGKKAKESNVLFGAILQDAHEKHIPMIFINRKYAAMNTNMFTSRDEKEVTSGGQGNSFAPSISLDFKTKIVYETIEYLDDNGKYSKKKIPVGTKFIIYAEKNRIGKQNMEVVMYIDNKKGLMPYYGLAQYADKAKLLEKGKSESKGKPTVWKIKGFGDEFKTIYDISDEAWEYCLENGLADYLRVEFSKASLFNNVKVKKEAKDVKLG